MKETDLRIKLSYILNNNYGKKIDRSSVYWDLLYNTLLNHPRKKDKIGCGVIYFFIQKSKWKRGQYNFMIKRADGSEEDFSFLKCLNNNYGKSKEWTNRFREIVDYQIKQYKESKVINGKFICELSGVIYDEKYAHIDHYGDFHFIDIFNYFIKKNDIDLKKINIEEDKKDGSIRKIIDENLRRDFAFFHEKKSKLRIIKDTINCSLPKHNG